MYDPPTPAEEKEGEDDDKATPCGCGPSDYGQWRTLAFSTLDEALAFLKSQEDTLKPRNYDDEYAKSFQATVDKMNKKTEKK